MKNINWKAVGNSVGQACKVVGYGVLAAVSVPIAIGVLAGSIAIDAKDTKSDNDVASSYMDVIRTIIDKVTFVSDQKKIICLVKKDETTEYYKTVGHIIENTTFASDIVGLIERLNGK